ncbi:hypothetical protein N8203_01460 [Crocinitomicaceae bacterium]|nr:hypothetical protein [Crocinitomicaceae bacterium]
MKLFMRNIFVFIFGFVFIIIIPILFVSNYDNLDKNSSKNHNIISLQTKSSFDSLDILFVGASYCYSSINTNYLDSLNIHSFNLGIATAGVQFYELIINDYLDNVSSPPKKVLLSVSPMTFSSNSDNFNAYPIHRYLENSKSNFEIAIKFNKLSELISMYRKSFGKGLANIYSPKEKYSKKKRLNNKGFYPDTIVASPEIITNDEILYLPFKSDIFDNSKLEDLLEIAKSINKKGSEVVFFELPTNLLYKYFSNNYLTEYKNGLNFIKKSFKLISLEPTLFCENNFRNIDHMNSSGSLIATKEIIRLLNKK